MGKRKITCRNTSCKFYQNKDECSEFVSLDEDGKCETFEKGFSYYFHIVWDALSRKNYIDALELNSDLRIGMFYVMECYGVNFSIQEFGTCRMFLLCDDDNKGLKYKDFVSRKINEEKLDLHYQNFINGIMPKGSNTEQSDVKKSETKPFGWLSPSGTFCESDFGTHEESAKKICKEKRFQRDEWVIDEKRNPMKMVLYRDFLIYEKGYALIHNPTGEKGYIVSHQKPLTKKQKNFLYSYFTDMGDRFKAEQFMK